MRRGRLLFGLVPALLAASVASSLPGTGHARQASGGRAVAITIDDLPYVGQPDDIGRAREVVEAMTAALREHGAPAEGFVTGTRVWVEGETDERLELLRTWRDAGVGLGGHGFHHVSFQTTPYLEYLDEAIAGLRFPIEIMAEVGGRVRYYRHPFNHTGPDAESKQRFIDDLAARGVESVPFTVEHADYVFSALWDDARAVGDEEGAARLLEAYLGHLDTAFDFAESLAEETFGRAIPQVFLIHSNGINGAALGAMLERLAARGYRFVPLEEALADPAYATPDTYVNRFGVSWLHRWRHGMGLPNALRHEPDPPAWVMGAYQSR